MFFKLVLFHLVCTWLSFAGSFRGKVSPILSYSVHASGLFAGQDETIPKEDKIYLAVPFEAKEIAKRLGARWDAAAKKWYINSFQPADVFDPWMLQYLNVPFDQKDEAKALGAKWDSNRQQWYAGKGVVNCDTRFSNWVTAADDNNDLVANDSSVGAAFVKTLGDGVLFLDIETNGLPQRRSSPGSGYPPYQDLAAYSSSRIVAFSCMLCDRTTLEPADTRTTIIKADEFPIDNAQFHGITLERSLKEGTYFLIAMQQMLPLLRQAKYVVAHNAEFDVVILKSELYRYGLTGALKQVESLKPVCTMHLARPIVGLSDKNGNPKNPSLKELYRFATGGAELEDHHNPEADVSHLRTAIKALVDRGLLEGFD